MSFKFQVESFKFFLNPTVDREQINLLNGQMSKMFRLRALSLSVGLFVLPALPSKAATQVEGVATYEVFENVSQSLGLSVKESFKATFEGGKWLVETKLISTQPAFSQPELFCPPIQAAGSDGGDTYFLKFMPKPGGTDTNLVGWIEPGSIPNEEQSPSVTLIWLAYCSGSYLTNAQTE
jgi:hypothetical protein